MIDCEFQRIQWNDVRGGKAWETGSGEETYKCYGDLSFHHTGLGNVPTILSSTFMLLYAFT